MPTEFASGLIARTFGGSDDGTGAGLVVEACSEARRKNLVHSTVTGF